MRPTSEDLHPATPPRWAGPGRLAVGLAVAASMAWGASPVGASTRAAGGADVTGQLTFGGRVRTYVEHRPPGFRPRLPVVLAFHGGGGTAAGMARISGLDAVADQHDFVVVYPQGVGNSWAGGKGDTPADTAGVDDVGFTAALIDHLAAEDGIDTRRVFATGLSSGGFMTQRLGCQLADRIAGIAPVAATLIGTIAQTCTPSRPMPVLEIQGTADPLVPYAGGHVRGRGPGGNPTLSAPATIAHWASVNGCATSPQTATLPLVVRDRTVVRTDTYTGCAAPVILYTVVGGGHTWPGGEQYLPALVVGRTSRQFNASQTMWSFFAGLPPRT